MCDITRLVFVVDDNILGQCVLDHVTLCQMIVSMGVHGAKEL